ncbi:MAG: hypothetical protein QF724_02275 [Planctomycetota bacterium]|jgi:hypothetical protein|nr:hypothetical protein [Planctomycetota bacterium]MDP6520112.1 hypothetical protein [Planctomycetota bacterium]MDP6837736.1 hypothetical protein [Planctomycetota bacterium]
MRNSLNTINGWMRDFTQFGIGLIITFLVVDILFPGTTGVMASIGTLVGQFSEQGLAGMIALLLFLALFRRDARPGDASGEA